MKKGKKMTRRKINCNNCGPETKARYSKITGVYWCHNCNTELPLKKEFVIIERMDVRTKKTGVANEYILLAE